MDANERLSLLVERLRRDGRVDVAEAAAEFGTADMTIRRDLEQLVTRGLARRIRGGAVSLLMRGEELPYAMREVDAVDSKRRIAAAVADLVADGEAVALDSGTTVALAAQALAGRRLTVLPLSLHAAMALAASPSVRLILPGGELRPNELAMAGPATLASIAALRFDTVVVGACGVSPEGQVMAHDLADAAVKQALLASARRKVLAIDGTKFGRAALAVVCDLTAFDIVVTDPTAPASTVDTLAAAGVEVRRV